MARHDRPAQLDLFQAAPGSHGSRGRGVSGRIAEYVDAAMAKGCTHVEVTKDGALLVTSDLVGRDAMAGYLPLSDKRVRNALSASGRSHTLQRCVPSTI